MTDGQFPLLSVALWAPAAGAAIVLLTRGRSAAAGVALFASVISLIAIVAMLMEFDRDVSGYQFVEEHEWMPSDE